MKHPYTKKRKKQLLFFIFVILWNSCPEKFLQQLRPTQRFSISPNEKQILIALKIQQWEGKCWPPPKDASFLYRRHHSIKFNGFIKIIFVMPNPGLWTIANCFFFSIPWSVSNHFKSCNHNCIVIRNVHEKTGKMSGICNVKFKYDPDLRTSFSSIVVKLVLLFYNHF